MQCSKLGFKPMTFRLILSGVGLYSWPLQLLCITLTKSSCPGLVANTSEYIAIQFAKETITE